MQSLAGLKLKKAEWVYLLVGIGAFLVLMLVRQPLVPAPWFDEGLNLSTAALIATQGVYGLPDSQGNRLLDPAIQTGPTVLLPVALSFRLLGINLLVGRLVIFLFAALAMICLVLVARRLLPPAGVFLTVVFALAGSREDFASFVYVGRQVLGEVPALGMLLFGLYLWLKSPSESPRSMRYAIAAGLVWGLASVTKTQVMLIFPVSLVCLGLLDGVYYRQRKIRAYLAALLSLGAVVVVWYAIQVYVRGWESFFGSSSTLKEGALLHIIGLNPEHWLNALRVIKSTAWFAWGFLSMAWGAWKARQRSAEGYAWAALLIFPGLALIWFTLFSIGWGRYAFFPFVYTAFFAAGLAVDLWRNPRFLRAEYWRGIGVAVILLVLAFNSGRFLLQLISPRDSGFADMAKHLQTALPATAKLEAWTWELDPFIPQPVHHPPTEVTNIFTAHLYSGQPVPQDAYDPLQAQPDYILDGPFSNWTGIYGEAIQKFSPAAAAFGQYALYEVKK